MNWVCPGDVNLSALMKYFLGRGCINGSGGSVSVDSAILGGGEIDDSFWDGLGHQPRVSSI